MLALDHLLWGAPDLDAASQLFADLTGVAPAPGGSHPGHGTRNALAALDGGRYFEVIAPDPAQEAAIRNAPANRGAELSRLRGPGLYAFALRARDLPGLADKALAAGVETDGPHAMGRATPEGGRIEWSILYLSHPAFEGVLHFALDWGATPHPATLAPGGCALRSFAVLRRDPSLLKETYRALGVQVEVAGGTASGFLAVLDTPRGGVVLREA